MIIIIGWIVTYRLLLNAYKQQHRNQIRHEIYKELISSLDDYASRLSEFSVSVSSFHYTKIYRDLGLEEKQIIEWQKQTTNLGTDLKFYLFLQKWETYAIFLQDLNPLKIGLTTEQEKLTKQFKELFLFKEPLSQIRQNRDNFIENLNAFSNQIFDTTAYVYDTKIVLQNFFYKQYGLKKLNFRMPEDDTYKILTNKGLITPKVTQEYDPRMKQLLQKKMKIISLRIKKAFKNK